MPILIYHDSQRQYQERTFWESIRIGSDPTNDLVLPSEAGVAPQHAVIMRTAVRPLHVLVDLTGRDTRVNGRRVVSLQVLHQRDEIQLGQFVLKMWELRINQVGEGDPSLGKTCKVCMGRFVAGDQIILCPQCKTPTHRTCSFSVNKCPGYLCEYPMQERIMDALAPWVAFSRYEVEKADIIEVRGDYTITMRHSGLHCPAKTRRDLVPFQPGEWVAVCPSAACQAAFHLECWLMLKACPRCQYDIQRLVDRAFSRGGESERREAYVR